MDGGERRRLFLEKRRLAENCFQCGLWKQTALRDVADRGEPRRQGSVTGSCPNIACNAEPTLQVVLQGFTSVSPIQPNVNA